MRELALFAGIGGGILGSALLGHKVVAACEIAEYPRVVLLQRQADRSIDRFPIWDDIRTLRGEQLRGHVDLVSGGFPCQRFSTAARGRNNAPDLWPEMLRVSLETGAPWVFAENVQRAPILRACEDLRAAGFRTVYTKISASDLGGPHKRARWWLLGHADSDSEPVGPEYAKAPRLPRYSGHLWPDPSGLGLRAPDGLSSRVDRMRAAGNGQVPIVAAVAFRHLLRALS